MKTMLTALFACATMATAACASDPVPMETSQKTGASLSPATAAVVAPVMEMSVNAREDMPVLEMGMTLNDVVAPVAAQMVLAVSNVEVSPLVPAPLEDTPAGVCRSICDGETRDTLPVNDLSAISRYTWGGCYDESDGCGSAPVDLNEPLLELSSYTERLAVLPTTFNGTSTRATHVDSSTVLNC